MPVSGIMTRCSGGCGVLTEYGKCARCRMRDEALPVMSSGALLSMTDEEVKARLEREEISIQEEGGEEVA